MIGKIEQMKLEEANRKIKGMQYLLHHSPWGMVEKLSNFRGEMKDKKGKAVFSFYGPLNPTFVIPTSEELKPFLHISMHISEGNNPVDVLKELVGLLGGTFSRDEGGSDTNVEWKWLSRDATEIEEQPLRVIVYSGAPPSCKIVRTTKTRQITDAYVDADGRIMTNYEEVKLDCSNDLEVSE